MSAVARRPIDAARRSDRDALDDTLVVEAAAGTGKTTELVNRIMRVIAPGPRRRARDRRGHLHREGGRRAEAAPAAAARAGARETRRTPDASPARRAVQNLEEAHVSTIHGFCADLLRERPVEARIDPLFRVLTEGQAQPPVRGGVRRLVPGAARGSARRRPPLAAAGRAGGPAGDGDEDGPIERLRRAGFELDRVARLHRPRGRAGLRSRRRDRRAASSCVARAGRSSPRAPSYAARQPVRRHRARLERSAATCARNAGARCADATTTVSRRSSSSCARNRDFKRAGRGAAPSYAQGRPARPGARRRATPARVALQRVPASTPTPTWRRCCSAELLACVDAYEQLKARKARSTSSTCCSARATWCATTRACAAHFQRRFTRIFVDEFQDTDPLQAELLLLLAADDPAETAGAQVTPVPGQAVHRRRSEAVDLPVPPRRRGDLPAGRASSW